MTGKEAVDYLVRETAELLGAGRVGLYELVWDLRKLDPTISGADAIGLTNAALQALVDQGAVIAWFVWPGLTPSGRYLGTLPVPPDEWNDPVDDQPFLGLILPRDIPPTV